MENLPTNIVDNFWDKHRILIKGFIIGFLTIVMIIPMAILGELVSERERRQNDVVNEISGKWASAQTVTGPIIALPYLTRPDSAKAMVKKMIYILPEKLNVNGKLLTELRHRSLYDVTLYRSNLALSGVFDPAVINKLGVAPESILWNEAQLMLGLDDARGLEEEVTLKWKDTISIFEAGLPDNNLMTTGLSAKLALDPVQKIEFSLNVKLKGSSYLYFTPVGKTTEVSLNSPWKDPAFDGQYLPYKQAAITDSGFSAQWKVLQVSRNYPQAWTDQSKYELQQSAFGVKLLQPTDNYAKTFRSVKYGVLIIALTFTIFFFVEIMQKLRVHPLQYVLVGIALCVFYTLLLSISEYTGFNIAYLIASCATVLLITAYVKSIFRKFSIAGGFAAALSALYTYIFVLIQLQDYALLYGSIGLFLILGIIMYFSRRIDWYSVKTN